MTSHSKSSASAENNYDDDDDNDTRTSQKKWVKHTLSKGRTLTKAEEVAETLGRDVLYADSELDELDIGEYKKDARLIILLGKRNTGKTVWMYNFCYENRHIYPYAFVLTKTKHNNFWQQIFPQHCILTEFNRKVIAAIMEMQKGRVQKRGINTRILLLLDDMAASDAARYASELTALSYNGRHYDIDIIYATQDVVKATTAMRRNVDLLVMLTTVNMTTLKHIYDEFCSLDYANMAHFVGNMLKHTEKFGTFCIDNSDANLRGRERFKKFRARKVEEIPKFTMLCDRAWGPAGRTVLADKQRDEYKQKPKYSENYMRQLMNAPETALKVEEVSAQDQLQRRHHDNPNPLSTLLHGPRP